MTSAKFYCMIVSEEDAGKRFPCAKETMGIGRSAGGNEIALAHDFFASNRHALIRRKWRGYYLMDLNSTNRTRLNGRPLDPYRPARLRHGDEFIIGKTRIRFLSARAIHPDGDLEILQGRDHEDRIRIRRKRLFIGRRTAGNQLVLNDQTVSGSHACLTFKRGRYFITDLNSTNGTRHNGEKIEPGKEIPLSHKDLIGLGGFEIRFLERFDKEPAPAETEAA